MSGWSVRVPASSANLGAGFDVLGMALTLHAEAGLGEPPVDAQVLTGNHPGRVAFARLGGDGELWMRAPIPAGRGLGFSGAARVAGGAAAMVQQHGPGALDDPDVLVELLQDAASMLLPVDAEEVRETLMGLRMARLLEGFRGKPRGDIRATVKAILAVADFAARNADRLVELDVNPLFVLPEGRGAIAADALVRMVE